ncbi:MAG: hypothetical protein L0H96_09385 [Humibacillus sp.]|nr:hypothetical protein [Humibacillus sp.]MDN5777111.1 hypothetical protein [Humibacillus sp.]
MDDVPDPQVPQRAKRRTYTGKYKRDVLAEYEAGDRDATATGSPTQVPVWATRVAERRAAARAKARPSSVSPLAKAGR